MKGKKRRAWTPVKVFFSFLFKVRLRVTLGFFFTGSLLGESIAFPGFCVVGARRGEVAGTGGA
ncbi:hypothetical protein FJNA_09490 [Thermus sp. FJN-A]